MARKHDIPTSKKQGMFVGKMTGGKEWGTKFKVSVANAKKRRKWTKNGKDSYFIKQKEGSGVKGDSVGLERRRMS